MELSYLCYFMIALFARRNCTSALSAQRDFMSALGGPRPWLAAKSDFLTGRATPAAAGDWRTRCAIIVHIGRAVLFELASPSGPRLQTRVAKSATFFRAPRTWIRASEIHRWRFTLALWPWHFGTLARGMQPTLKKKPYHFLTCENY